MGRRSPKARIGRTQLVRQKAKTPNTEARRLCAIIGCGQPTRAAGSGGLDRRYCRIHADHHSRHGDPLRKTYAATILNPYRDATKRWIADNEDQPAVSLSIRAVEGLYRAAGPARTSTSLAGLTARQRANVVWSRLREAGVDPRKPVEAWLAVCMVIEDDPVAPSRQEWRLVQAAKVVHRMASGIHRKWEITGYEIHHYPHSRGRVLRVVGHDLSERMIVSDRRYLDQILGLVDASARSVMRDQLMAEIAEKEKAIRRRQQPNAYEADQRTLGEFEIREGTTRTDY